MSSGGGGKGGGKKTTTETTVPEFIRGPADRNLQRAEALQQIEYMPYYGPQVAAFNPNQEMAFQNNANAASAFGLLAPTDAMAGMPTPTTYDNGMKGYSSMPLYDQAMTDLKANYGDTVDAYDSLFGNAVPANAAPQSYGGGSGGGGGGGGITPRGGVQPNYNPYNPNTWSTKDKVAHQKQVSPNSTNSQLESAYGQKSTYVPKAKDRAHKANVQVNKINKAAGNYRTASGKKLATRTGGKYGFGL